MDDIFLTDPAPFPGYDAEELDSVKMLEYLLDKKRVKPFFNTLDKYPNIDGFVNIVDGRGISLGRCDVQIKTLPDKFVLSPKHQCSVKFLSYCATSLNPVFLILVNSKSQIAYWQHFSRKRLKEIAKNVKGKTVAIHLPLENQITRAASEYPDQWTEILATYIKKKITMDNLEEQIGDLENLEFVMRNLTMPKYSIKKEYLYSLNTFISTLNDALDNEFNAIKETIYSEYNKLSVAYCVFRQDWLSYALVPVKKGSIDLLVKELPENYSLMEDRTATLVTSYHGSNPMIDAPKQHAYSIIKRDLFKILKNENIQITNIPLAQENITEFFDKFRDVFPMVLPGVFSVENLTHILKFYLPIWVEEYHKYQPDYQEHVALYMDLNHMSWHTFDDEISLITAAAHLRFENKDFCKSEIVFEDESESYDANIVLEDLKHLENQGTLEFAQPFAFKRHGDGGYIWNWYTAEQAEEKVRFLYEQLAQTYDQFISIYFPQLAETMRYYGGFDLLVIHLTYGDSFESISDSPSIEKYYLKAVKNNVEPKISVFLNDKGDTPINRRSFYPNRDEPILIDGVTYNLVSSSWGALSPFFETHDLRKMLYVLLLKRFGQYFDKNCVED